MEAVARSASGVSEMLTAGDLIGGPQAGFL
jgi:hypothetical protein